VKERGILMSAPMVCACLRDLDPKTKTRRAIKPQPSGAPFSTPADQPRDTKRPGEWLFLGGDSAFCPYGVPGDRLYVRETCRAEEIVDGRDGVRYRADDAWRMIENTREAADRFLDLSNYRGKGGDKPGPWVNSIHMPRWASRLTLEITEVRVERLGDISEADAIAEGLIWHPAPLLKWSAGEGRAPLSDPRRAYADLWSSINGDYDPAVWVWALSFRRVTP
jgi:hypothetical protein